MEVDGSDLSDEVIADADRGPYTTTGLSPIRATREGYRHLFPVAAPGTRTVRANPGAWMRGQVTTSASVAGGAAMADRPAAGTEPIDLSDDTVWHRVFAQGEERYRAGYYTKSATIFARLATARPDWPVALRGLGLSRLRLGETTVALELLARARELAPDDPLARLHHGIALHAADRHDEAVVEFRASAAALPDDPAPFLNLASSLLALGHAATALDAARRARRRAPRSPQAAYIVGMALLANGRTADAEAAFAAALHLEPRLVGAWISLGVALYRRGDIAGAIRAMRRALDLDPENHSAAANLGAFLRLTGETEAAEAISRRLLERHPNAVEARLNAAAEHLREERGADALALLDAVAAPSDPRPGFHWRLQRAQALLQLARTDEARALLVDIGEPPAGMGPLLAWRRVLLALADGDAPRAVRLAEAMEQSLAATDMLPEHRIMAHFDLAKFWSGRNEAGRAFPHWTAGHQELRRFQPFSRDMHRAFVDATIDHFDRTRLFEGGRAENSDTAPVFIVGMPRSGTTLTQQILAAHPHVFAAGERGDLGAAFNRLGNGTMADAAARVAALDGPALDAAARGFLARLRALAPDAARIVDKMPGNFLYLGLVALMLPGARIIHCVRDPRDVGLSIFTYRFFSHHPYAHDLGDLGWYIGEHDRLMAHWYGALPNPLLTVRLSDWVNDFSATLRRILVFLDLPYDPRCERFHEQDHRVGTVSRSQVKQPINARGIGRWRGYEEHLGPLLAALRRIRCDYVLIMNCLTSISLPLAIRSSVGLIL